jgi:hypothetical protein
MTIVLTTPPKITVQDDNVLISPDVDIINFGSGISVVNDGYGKITASGFGGGSLYLKSGIVSAGSFAGNPKKATVTFSSAFPSTSYSITITGGNGRTWTYESKATGSFVINTNANSALSQEVSWQAIIVGEFN